MDVCTAIRNLVITHYEARISCRKISEMVGVPKSIDIRLVKRYKDTGSVLPKRVGHCVPQNLLSERDERCLSRRVWIIHT
jgi:transposase